MAKPGQRRQGKVPLAQRTSPLSARSILCFPVHAVQTQLSALAEGAARRQVHLRTWHSLFKRMEIGPPLLVLMYLTYNAFCQAVVSVFSCSEPLDGKRYLTVDMNVQCYTAPHVVSLVMSGLLLVCVCLGLPGLFAWILYRNRRNLYDPRIYSLLGALFDGFDAEHGTYAWQAVIMLRNFALVAVMRSVSESQLQLMGSMLVTVLALGLHLACQPYTVLFYNQLETLSLGSVVFAQTMSVSLLPVQSVAASAAAGSATAVSPAAGSAIAYLVLAVQASVIVAFLAALASPPAPTAVRRVSDAPAKQAAVPSNKNARQPRKSWARPAVAHAQIDNPLQGSSVVELATRSKRRSLAPAAPGAKRRSAVGIAGKNGAARRIGAEGKGGWNQRQARVQSLASQPAATGASRGVASNPEST